MLGLGRDARWIVADLLVLAWPRFGFIVRPVECPASDARPSATPGEPVRLVLLLLFGCDAAKPVVTGDLACAEGEIRVLSTGALHGSLADAMAAVADDDTICVGPGTYDLAESLDCRHLYPADDDRTLTIAGAGSDRTRLVGYADAAPEDGCRDLRLSFWEPTDRIALEGLTFTNAAVYVGAGVVTARDLRVEDFAGAGSPALRLWGSASLDVESVTVTGSRSASGGGFVFMGVGDVRDVVVASNEFDSGYFGTFHGTLTVDGLAVTDNVRTAEEPGFDLVEFFGDVAFWDATFAGNRTNGPLLSGVGTFTGTGLTFADNEANWRSVVSAYGDGSVLTLADARFDRNAGADAALGVYDDASAVLAGVDFVDNAPCDVLSGGACLTGLGEDVELACDGTGCSER